MRSPFPGMDPYLEGYLWSDVHHVLASEIRKQIMPFIQPNYTARLAVTIFHETILADEINIFLPDIEVLTKSDSAWNRSASEATEVAIMERPITQSIIIPLAEAEIRTVDVEIYDVVKNQLITSIELLSPVNKREPGLTKYREKQERLRQAGIHLLEIDLLRGGKRRSASPFMQNYKAVNDAHYLVTLTRALANACNVWPINLQDELPVVAVPLRAPDPDIALDLSVAFRNIYEDARYDLSIDYNADPPPPVLKGSDAKWVQELLTSSAMPNLDADNR